MKFALSVIVSLMFLVGCASDDPSYWIRWTAPTDGTDVVRYIVEYTIDGETWVPYATTNNTQLRWSLQSENYRYRVRVAGRDKDLEVGVWSEPSEEFSIKPKTK